MKSHCYDDPKGLKVKLHEKEMLQAELDTINCQDEDDAKECLTDHWAEEAKCHCDRCEPKFCERKPDW